MNKLEVKYPCSWEYKIIGDNEDSLRSEVSKLFGDVDYNLDYSKQSSSGKFVSLNLEITVSSEEEKNEIYSSLKKNHFIKMVL